MTHSSIIFSKDMDDCTNLKAYAADILIHVEFKKKEVSGALEEH